MIVKDLKSVLDKCNDDGQVIIFALTEDDNYRPFKNISAEIYDEGSFHEELHLDISIYKEFKSIHFKDNLTEEEVLDLLDKRDMLLEELEELDDLVKDYI